jgi:hypothetical protein
MFRTMLAAVAVIPLLLGVGASFAAAEDAAPEPPRNRLSPTDDSELPQRTVPPLAPPQPLIQRRISEPSAEEPRAAPPEVTAPPRAIKPQPAAQGAMKHRVATQRLVTKQAKPPRVTARQTPPRRVIAVRTQRQDNTSLGALFTGTPPSRSPEAAPSAPTYNYFGTPARQHGATCPTRSRTSISALFACTR